MQEVTDYVNSLPDVDVVVSGRARGVDKEAASTARKRGLLVVEFIPDWDHPKGKRFAAFERNQKIVDNCDRLVAFHYGDSNGTADTIAKARLKGMPVEVFEA